jgi:uracil phosphoribosyltransferase
LLIDHSNDPLMQLLVNTTRQVEVAGPALADAHRAVGRCLAGPIAQALPLESVEIQHVVGASEGVGVRPGHEPIILAVMRAGLFVAEGIWSCLPASALVPHQDGESLGSIPAQGRTVILVDSVINTGRSLRRLLEMLRPSGAQSIVVSALVAYGPTLETLVAEYADVTFNIARVSQRSYVGSGSTDTGARLFGTTTWAGELVQA